jgi:hypothetical protein
VRVEQELEGLTLLDLSDREFLLVVRDAGGVLPNYVTAEQVAVHLRLIGENPVRSVSARLSWLKRYGAVDREYERDHTGNIRENRNGKPVYTQGWALSELGLQMAVGNLTKTQQASLERLGDGQMLMTMRLLSQRVIASNSTVSKLMDREYRHGVGRR